MKSVLTLGESVNSSIARRLLNVWLLRDYPYTTVPNQVHRLFRAQQLHDRKHYDERITTPPEKRAQIPYVDYLRPIIADADTG